MAIELSIDRRLNEGLRLRGMPVVEFANVAALEGISGASKARLFQAFRDDKPLPNDVAERLWALWQEIEALAESVVPLKLDLRDGARVYEWLTQQKHRKLLVLTILTEPKEPAEEEI